jgi:hypothetical protein
MKKTLDRAKDHVAALHAAKRQLGQARQALARTTTPDGPHVFIEPASVWAQRLVDERAAGWMRIPGVVGVGLGSKITGGLHTSALCATVFVTRKLTPATLEARGRPKLPRWIRKGGRTLPIDVVQIGRFTRQAFTGESCSVSDTTTRTATIGAPAVEDGTGASVFITAMHVTGRQELDPAGGVALAVNAPSVFDAAGAPVVGRLTEGSRKGIDAAKVVLSAGQTVLRDVPTIGPIRGWRPLTFPGDQGAPVRMFGAATRVAQHGIIVHPTVFMPGIGLDSAIVVGGFQANAGDSGAALLDAECLVLGFLVGSAGDGQCIFCPASLVLSRLHCDIPTHL